MAVTHTYEIQGMHCQSCVAKVTAALQRVTGIESATVALSPPHARVAMNRHVSATELHDSLRKAGDYRLTDSPPDKAFDSSAPQESERTSLFPLGLILAYLVGTVAVVSWATHDFSTHALMSRFMGGFFLVFSFFKLLDLRGFVATYRSYDIIAKASPPWGYAYPFVELALGIGYVVNWNPVLLNTLTLLIMLAGSEGVLRALLRRNAIQCACLGTALKLPMTKVTLLEDLGMAVMAAAMLIAAR